MGVYQTRGKRRRPKDEASAELESDSSTEAQVVDAYRVSRTLHTRGRARSFTLVREGVGVGVLYFT